MAVGRGRAGEYSRLHPRLGLEPLERPVARHRGKSCVLTPPGCGRVRRPSRDDGVLSGLVTGRGDGPNVTRMGSEVIPDCIRSPLTVLGRNHQARKSARPRTVLLVAWHGHGLAKSFGGGPRPGTTTT